jgi:hypothetical protein
VNVYGPAAADNPFSASRIRPGAMPFLFAAGHGPEPLVECLRRNGWWGQITGAHGSGKSALVAALVPWIDRAGKRTVLVELHDGQRRLPAALRDSAALAPETVVIVDGYEQLTVFNRWRLRRLCRRHGAGLLVTAHCDVGLPELFHTAVDLSSAERIVAALQREYPVQIVAADVARRFSRRGGDMRETLFDLYDLYEQCRRRI